MYSFLKSFSDPVVAVLIFMAAGIWGLKVLRNEKYKKFVWWTYGLSFVILYCLSIAPVAKALAYTMEKDFLREQKDEIMNVDVVVVLGGGLMRRGLQSHKDPTNETAARLLYGLTMLKQTGAKKMILSGAGGIDTTEAEVMADICRTLGIDEKKIITETGSRNTWEHAEEINMLLQDKDLDIGIVTSAIHMKRSVMVFNKYFKHIRPLPSAYIYSPLKFSIMDLLPNTGTLYRSSNVLYEMLGMVWYNIRMLTV